MSVGPSRCPKCNGEMAQGFLFEIDGPMRKVGTWVEGPPEKSWFGSTKVPADRCVPIATFRCSGCCFLESYAYERQSNSAAQVVELVPVEKCSA